MSTVINPLFAGPKVGLLTDVYCIGVNARISHSMKAIFVTLCCMKKAGLKKWRVNSSQLSHKSRLKQSDQGYTKQYSSEWVQ